MLSRCDVVKQSVAGSQPSAVWAYEKRGIDGGHPLCHSTAAGSPVSQLLWSRNLRTHMILNLRSNRSRGPEVTEFKFPEFPEVQVPEFPQASEYTSVQVQ